MKKYWRCFVCNDVHYGVKPPGVCPTCFARNAYVLISAAEALKICRPDAAMGKEEFLEAIRTFAEGNEFEVNPDPEKAATLLEGIFNNEANHGLKYCPCRLRTKDFDEDLKIICPCNFLIHETYKGLENGECWCGLFVRRSR